MATRMIQLMLLCVSCFCLQAQDQDPRVEDYLTKWFSFYQQGFFQMNLKMTSKGTGSNQAGSMDMTGHFWYADRTHTRFHIEGNLNLGLGENKIGMTQVMDGDYNWIEFESSAFGGTQVIKISLEAMAQGLAEQGLPSMLESIQVDPQALVQALKETLVFKVIGEQSDRLLMEAEMTQAFLKNNPMGQSIGAKMGEDFKGTTRLEFQKNDIFPIDIQMMFPGFTLDMSLADFRPLQPEALKSDIFTYQPPKGVPVMDLSHSMGKNRR